MLTKLEKCTGPADNIPSYFVKLTPSILLPYSTNYIEILFKLGIFPSSLEVATVIPIFEKCSIITPLKIIGRRFLKKLYPRNFQVFFR